MKVPPHVLSLYFENKTSDGNTLYIELIGSDNPFDGIHATTVSAAPAFADIDQDGDLDLFLGQNGWPAYGQTSLQGIEYYRNDGGTFAKQTGAWIPQPKKETHSMVWY